ncbi:class I SAM-dependent methyltransferase [Candidatus Microgenomates bacterium]|nr:class I SAM-dependent methyltransferase [Candidatus Microgenomates bacterium]
MDFQEYWAKKHQKYLSEDWIDRPTLFAKFAVEYLPKTGKILDLGAGQGQDSRFFAKLGYKVTSTDFSDEALRISAQKAKDDGVNIKFHNVDLAKTLPFREAEFDVVYAHLSLHYFNHETTQQLFSEIFRILKTGGVMAALFNTTEDPEMATGIKIEEGLYEVEGLAKRFFSLKYLEQSVSGKFTTIVADNKGETYKDKIKTLVRFVGKKI